MPDQQIKDFIAQKVPVEINHTNVNGAWLWAIQVAETDFWLEAYNSVEKAVKFCTRNQLPYKLVGKN